MERGGERVSCFIFLGVHITVILPGLPTWTRSNLLGNDLGLLPEETEDGMDPVILTNFNRCSFEGEPQCGTGAAQPGTVRSYAGFSGPKDIIIVR